MFWRKYFKNHNIGPGSGETKTLAFVALNVSVTHWLHQSLAINVQEPGNLVSCKYLGWRLSAFFNLCQPVSALAPP
jgi:hypothetical protein